MHASRWCRKFAVRLRRYLDRSRRGPSRLSIPDESSTLKIQGLCVFQQYPPVPAVRCAPILFSNGSRDDNLVLSDVDAFGCLRSLRARVALDGVSWVWSGSVEIAVGTSAACYRIGAVIYSLPRASLPLGSSVRPPVQ